MISGPVIDGKGRGGRRNQSSNALATAFKDAWKQGNLASEVSTY